MYFRPQVVYKMKSVAGNDNEAGASISISTTIGFDQLSIGSPKKNKKLARNHPPLCNRYFFNTYDNFR